MAANPAQVVVAEGRAGHDEEALVFEAGDGEIALDPAPPVQHLGVGDLADRTLHLVVAQALEEVERPGTTDLDLGEARLVEQRGRSAGSQRLRSDGGRPVLTRPATRSERLVAIGSVGLEPVGALPSGLLAEGAAQLGEAWIGRRQAQRAPGAALLVRVVDVVVGGVHLGGAGEGVGARPVLGAEAANVHRPQVELRLAVDDPLRQLFPQAAGAGNAVGGEPGRDEQPANRRFAQDELVVGGEPLRAVDEPRDACLVHGGHPPHGPGGDLLEARPVGGQQLAVEVGRDALQRPRRRVALVATHHQPSHLGPEIDQVVRIAQLGEVGRHALDRLGDQVLVGKRNHRDRDARHAPDLPGKHARGIDHHLAGDRSALRLDASHPPAVDADAGHPSARQDCRSAAPCPGREGLRQARWIQVAVGRQPGGAKDPIGDHQREAALGLIRADQIHRQAIRLGPTRLAAQLLHPFRRAGQPERANLAPAGIHSCFVGERPIGGHAVSHHPGQRGARAQLAHQAGRVEGRA